MRTKGNKAVKNGAPKTKFEIEVTYNFDCSDKPCAVGRWTRGTLNDAIDEIADDGNMIRSVARMEFFLASAYDGIKAIAGGGLVRRVVFTFPDSDRNR